MIISVKYPSIHLNMIPLSFQVHLTQLRGSGGQELVRDRDQEIEVLRGEVKNSRTREQEAQERLVKLAGERDQLAEQYRSYSRDLATQVH